MKRFFKKYFLIMYGMYYFQYWANKYHPNRKDVALSNSQQGTFLLLTLFAMSFAIILCALLNLDFTYAFVATGIVMIVQIPTLFGNWHTLYFNEFNKYTKKKKRMLSVIVLLLMIITLLSFGVTAAIPAASKNKVQQTKVM